MVREKQIGHIPFHMSSHVCILGCGRSGTSIFGELFDHLPEYTYFSEPPFADLPNFDYSQPIAIKVPTPTPGILSDPGLPFQWEEFLSKFPEPRILYWQVRHPLDTICSLRVGISKNWGHHPRPNDWKEWLDKPLLVQCAHHWNYLNTVGYERVKKYVIVNRFEEMILDSMGAAKRICKEIGLDHTSHKDALTKWSNRVQDKNNHQFKEAKTSQAYSRNDHVRKVGRWEENLRSKDIDLIRPFILDGAANFGYELP